MNQLSKIFAAVLKCRKAVNASGVRYNVYCVSLSTFSDTDSSTRWTGLQRLQLISQATLASAPLNASAIRLNDILCKCLEHNGYDYTDVASQWSSLSFTHTYQVRWVTMALIAEGKELTVENLMKRFAEEGPCTLPAKPTVDDCLSVFSSLLRQGGANEKSLDELIKKLKLHEIPNNTLIRQIIHSIEVSRILLRYFGSHPDLIISEYLCLLPIDIKHLLQNVPEIESIGLVSPSSILNYLTGSYTHPRRRQFQSFSTIQVCSLLGLSREEAAKNNFSTFTIMYILSNRGYNGIEETFNYLINAGYLRAHIASCPLILAFSDYAIGQLIETAPKPFISKFHATSNMVEKLTLIFNTLDEAQGFKMTNYYLQNTISPLPEDKTPFRLT